MDVDNELQITNSFPFPSADAPQADDKHDKHDTAAAAPRAKANTYYQTEMVRCLREMNVDANSVGWYQSASLGNFVRVQYPDPFPRAIYRDIEANRNSSTPTSSRTSTSTSPVSTRELLPWFTTLPVQPLVPCLFVLSVLLLSSWLPRRRVNSLSSLSKNTT
jgi:hypothetical protein